MSVKIFNNPQIQQVMKSYQKNVGKTEKTEAVAMAKDQIEISSQARDIQVAMKALKDVPEVRQDRIDQIREDIESGQYKPSSDAVADKLLAQLKNRDL